MSYGQSFAMKHLREGRYDEALAEADRAATLDPDDPEPVLERAQILLAMDRFDEVVPAIERTVRLDEAAGVCDDMIIDDTLFSALVGWAQRTASADREGAVALMGRYATIFPRGIHHAEAEEWVRRFRGQVETWVKAR